MLKIACAIGVSTAAVANGAAAVKNANVGIAGTDSAPVVENKDYGVEYVGNSGQFRLYYKADSKRSVKVQMLKLEEHDKDGKVTTRKETSWANKATSWTATDGKCPPGTTADTCTKVSFSTPIALNGEKTTPQFTFDTYLIHQTTAAEPICTAFDTTTNTCTLYRCKNAAGANVDCVKKDGSFCVEVPATDKVAASCNATGIEVVSIKQEQNALKFSVGVTDWPFGDPANTLHFGVRVEDQGGSGSFNVTNEKATEVTVVSTPSGNLKLEQYVTVKDAAGKSTTKECSVTAEKNNVVMVFPSFAASMYYDPAIIVAAPPTDRSVAAGASPAGAVVMATVAALVAAMF